MELLIALFAWVVLSQILAEAIPHLFQLFGMLVYYLCLCIWEVLQLLGKVAAFVGRYSFRAARWTCRHSWLFLVILLDEWRHGSEDAEEELFEDEEPEDAAQQAYDAALAQLGLREPFALADLKRVYRQAMKTAHTDVGGSKDAAVALNTARDLIMEVKGWN